VNENENEVAIMEEAEVETGAPEIPELASPAAPQPFDGKPSWGDGLSPMEMISGEANDPLIYIERVEALGPDQGYDDGAEGEGYCGTVDHRNDFQSVVRKKWGGGKYKATTTLRGKPVSKTFTHAGIPSKPIDAEESEWEPPHASVPAYQSPAAGYASQYPGQAGYAPTPSYGQQHDPYGYDQRRQQPSYGYPRAGGVAGAYGRASYAVDETSESEVLRSELDVLKEALNESQRSLEVAAVKRDAEMKEAESRRHMDALKAQLDSLKDALTNGGGGRNDHIEILKAQIEMDRERYNRQEAAAAKRAEQEIEARREKDKREETRRREDDKRYDRERQERLDREKREADARRDERKAEREQARDERNRQESNNDRMFKMMFQNRKDPLEELVKLKQIEGSGLSKIREVTGVMTELKQLASAEVAEPSKLDQIQQFVAGTAEATVPMIGALAEAFRNKGGGEGSEPEYVPNNAQGMQPQAPELEYAPESIRYGEQEYPQPQPRTQPQPQDASGVTPAQWGQILELAVDSFNGRSQPDMTAQHLLTCMKFSNCLGALPELAKSNAATLKLKVKMLKMSGRIQDPHFQGKLGDLLEVMESPQGAAWVAALLDEFRRLHAIVTRQTMPREPEVEPQAPNPAPQAQAGPVPQPHVHDQAPPPVVAPVKPVPLPPQESPPAGETF
jgi:hypothetical protein